jgi:6,7-dimethyl-8-ribityllumazine synthase
VVLDEDALEAMLARQRVADDRPPSNQAQLTQETAEFEVYERPEREEAAASTRPGSHAPFPPMNAPDPAHVARAADTTPAAEAPAQMPPPAAPARPRVMPPLSSHAPQTVAPGASAAHTVTGATSTRSAPSGPSDPPHARHGDVRLGVVHCLFNHEITDRMVEVAQARAAELGADVTTVLQVAGVYDAPLAAQRLARSGAVDAIVVIGCVVRGETTHDEVITHATARSLQQVALDHDIPVGFGVTGPGMSWVEAEARIGNAAHAVEAVVGVVRMAAH